MKSLFIITHDAPRDYSVPNVSGRPVTNRAEAFVAADDIGDAIRQWNRVDLGDARPFPRAIREAGPVAQSILRKFAGKHNILANLDK